MFHLFNRVYIEHERWFASLYDHCVIHMQEGNHPVARRSGLTLIVPSFEDYIKESFQGDIENFWSTLITKPKDKPFMVYVDQGVFDRLQIQFWKSVFQKRSVEEIYRLFKFYYLDNRLKSFLNTENKIRFEDTRFRSDLMPFEEFNQLFESLPVVNNLVEMDKQSLSFEYLLANYFLDTKSQYAKAFLVRLEDLSWKAFFDNIDILRSEILNSFYDFKKILPEVSLNFDNIEEVESFILSEPKLKWISDPEFNNRNRKYVLNNYSKEDFLSLTREMAKNWVLYPDITDEEVEKQLECEDHYQLIKCIFEGKFEKLLEMSMAKNFGCIFVSDDMSNKANQILPLFIYDKVRTHKLDELEFLRFS